MLSRRKNLLEAFRRSDPSSAPPPSPARSAAPSPSAAPGPLFESIGARSAGVGGRPASALILIGLVVAFVLGFVLGRSSGSPRSEAKDAVEPAAVHRTPPQNQPRTFQTPPAAAPAAAETTESTRLG